MRALFRSVLVATSLYAVGCGGGLKYKIDDALLADVPPAEKADMLKIQSDINVAGEEKNKAVSDAAITSKEVSVAEAEYDQAKAEVTKVKAERELAETTKDLNRITAAKTKLQQVELARDVADAKVDWQKARRSHAKAFQEALKAKAPNLEIVPAAQLDLDSPTLKGPSLP